MGFHDFITLLAGLYIEEVLTQNIRWRNPEAGCRADVLSSDFMQFEKHLNIF